MMNLNKIKKYIPIIILIIFFIILVTVSMMSSYSVLVKDSKSQYYKAKIIFISGNNIIYLKGDEHFRKKSSALNYKKYKFHFSIESMLNISYIEIIPEEDDDQDYDVADIPREHLGTYTIYVTGHTGILSFYVSKDRLYGILRFPNWARGVNEYLKGVWISKNKVRFTRSITNARELKRVGANSYFTQKFYGNFSNNGRKINGVYYNNGIKSIWEASRIK